MAMIAKLRLSLKLSDRDRNLWRNSFQELDPTQWFKESDSTREIQNFGFTFWVIVCEQLDVELLGEGGQVGRHHAAGGQVHLVTAGLHLVRDKRTSSSVGC